MPLMPRQRSAAADSGLRDPGLAELVQNIQRALCRWFSNHKGEGVPKHRE